MKKRIVTGLVIFLLLLAGEINCVTAGNWELDGGLNYNTFFLTDINDHLQARNDYLENDLFVDFKDYTSPLKDLDTTYGHFLTLKYWSTDNLALGGEVEFNRLNTEYTLGDLNGTYYRESYDLALFGLLGIVSYQQQVTNRIETNLQAGLGYYSSDFTWSKDFDFSSDIQEHETASYTGDTIGGKLGTNIEILLFENLSLISGINYRYVVFDQLQDSTGQTFASIYDGDLLTAEQFNYSGLEFRNSIQLKF